MKIRIGLQTITWGDPQDPIMDRILDTAAACGYDGVEMGWRRIAPMGAGKLRQMLVDRGLSFIAAHAGGNLEDRAQADDERQQIDVILEGIQTLKGSFLMYSGLRYKSDEQLAQEIASLNAIAGRCAEAGVRLLYHNHDWEFLANGRAFEALLNETVPELGFCPDFGWLAKTGQDAMSLMEQMRDRIGAVHFKDFRTAAPGEKDVCCLGEGEVPLREAAAWIEGLDLDELWVIAEQDHHNGPAEEAAKRNAEFMKSCFGRTPCKTSA